MLVRGPPVPAASTCSSAHPLPDLDQSKTGGFLDPLIGTVILTVIGHAIALPLGVAIAVWLTEYGRPSWLARAVESGIEIVAGTPSIVLAIFGLLIFSAAALRLPLLHGRRADAVFGRSFFTAGAMMSLIALPLSSARRARRCRRSRGHVREASYALGKTKAATIRRVLLPASRAGHRHRHGARHGPDRRRHGDRRDPARRLAAAPGRGRRAGRSARCAAPAAR